MRNVNLLLCIFLVSASAAAQTATPEPEITVRNLTLDTSPGVLPADTQQQIIRSVQGQTYKHSYLVEITQRVRFGLQTYGYFQAKVSDPSITVVTETPQQEVVDITLAVTEGQQFRLKDILFTGEKAFPAEQLRVQFHIADGDIFNTEKIRQGLEALRHTYESKGYVNFTPVPHTQANSVARTISLTVDIDEGAQFRIGGLVLDGPEPQPGVGRKVLESWKQYQGQIYNPQILEQFLRDNSALLPPGVSWKDLSTQPDGSLHILNFRLDLPDSVDGNAKAN
jgi:outer membrane translocation and assembly module TamA